MYIYIYIYILKKITRIKRKLNGVTMAIETWRANDRMSMAVIIPFSICPFLSIIE